MSDKITIVLGAGASRALDPNNAFPVGGELAIAIEQLLDHELGAVDAGESGVLVRAMMHRETVTQQHIKAMKRIRDGIQSKNSIDEFIAEWEDISHLPDIAKLCIAHILLEAERKSRPFALDKAGSNTASTLRAIRGTWLGTILSNANHGVMRRDIAKCLEVINFVTFNYDRSLEQSLYHSFINTYNMSPESAMELLVSINIFHVYGDLGQLPGSTANGVPYGAEYEVHILNASKRIRTFSQEIDSAHAGHIRTSIQESSIIVFLGCAYHDQNMDILFSAPPLQKVFGTVYNLRPRARIKAATFLSAAGYTPALEDMDCTTFINHFQEEIFE